MKIITTKFIPCSGAISTYNTIEEAGKIEEFETLIEELYPNGITVTLISRIKPLYEKHIRQLARVVRA